MNNKHDNKLRKYKISIFKENYFLVSDENEEHLINSVELVNSYLKAIITKCPEVELRKASILVAIQLASKSLKSTQEIESFKKQSDQLTNFIDIETAQFEKSEKI